MKLTLFTVLWGPMVEWYLKGCLPSLIQEQNIPSSAKQVEGYIIYTDAEEQIKADPAFILLNNFITVNFRPLLAGPNNVNVCTLDALRHCYINNTYAAIVSPDHIYGNGSIKYLTEICEPGTTDLICYGFPRVNLPVLDQVANKLKAGESISNAELVRLALDNAHWETTVAGSGVNIYPKDKNTWEVSHTVPTVVFKASERIVQLMESNKTYNSGYDHWMPHACVKMGMSAYFIDHSDKFFVVEPTDRQRALCQEIARPGEFGSLNEANRNYWSQFRQTWRA